MKAFIYKAHYEAAIKGESRPCLAVKHDQAIYLERPSGNVVEITLPDPPKPFEAEVWICDGGSICQTIGKIECSVDRPSYNCRKITVREVK